MRSRERGFRVRLRRGGPEGGKELGRETAKRGLLCLNWEKLYASHFTCQLGQQHLSCEEVMQGLDRWSKVPPEGPVLLHGGSLTQGLTMCIPQEKWGALL